MDITKVFTQPRIATYFVNNDGVEYDVHLVTYPGHPYDPLVLVRGPRGWEACTPPGEYQGDNEGAVRDGIAAYLAVRS